MFGRWFIDSNICFNKNYLLSAQLGKNIGEFSGKISIIHSFTHKSSVSGYTPWMERISPGEYVVADVTLLPQLWGQGKGQ